MSGQFQRCCEGLGAIAQELYLAFRPVDVIGTRIMRRETLVSSMCPGAKAEFCLIAIFASHTRIRGKRAILAEIKPLDCLYERPLLGFAPFLAVHGEIM